MHSKCFPIPQKTGMVFAPHRPFFWGSDALKSPHSVFGSCNPTRILLPQVFHVGLCRVSCCGHQVFVDWWFSATHWWCEHLRWSMGDPYFHQWSSFGLLLWLGLTLLWPFHRCIPWRQILGTCAALLSIDHSDEDWWLTNHIHKVSWINNGFMVMLNPTID